MSIDKIQIDKLRDTIIVEKVDGKSILAGSKLFCGCCGNSLGEVTKKITFPFQSHQLMKILINKTFRTSIFGLRHETCKHTLHFCSAWDFISLENYNKELAKEK